MKSILSTLLCALCVLSLNSCGDDENTDSVWGNSEPPPFRPYILEGGRISDIGLYCVPPNGGTGETWYDYYKGTKTLTNYSDAEFILMPNTNAWVYNTDDLEEWTAISKLENKYQEEKTLFMYEDYKECIKHAVTWWPDYFSAYINGDVTIVCDKTLWGEAPGTNLIGHFIDRHHTPCMPVGIENPALACRFGEKIPENLQERLINGAWVKTKYILKFTTEPTEKYSELTFHLTMPMRIEHIRDYAVAKYKGEDAVPVFTNHMFETDCKILFEW